MPYDKSANEKFLREVQQRRVQDVPEKQGQDFAARGPTPEREAERDATDDEKHFGSTPLSRGRGR